MSISIIKSFKIFIIHHAFPTIYLASFFIWDIGVGDQGGDPYLDKSSSFFIHQTRWITSIYSWDFVLMISF